MFYPSGETPNGKTVVCIEDERAELDKLTEGCEDFLAVEEITEWLAEHDYCVEAWQMKEYLISKGVNESIVNEDMAAGGAPAPAGAPAAGFATLGTVTGMGNPATPQNGGTNSGFYNNSLNGSGDKFSTLTAGTAAGKKEKKKTRKIVTSYLDFVKLKKK